MKTIDARGLSCPEPVVLLRTAMASGEDSYQINTAENGGEWTLTFTK